MAQILLVGAGGGGGGGDVVGPGASTNNALVRWAGASGTNVANSNAILSDLGALTLAAGLAATTVAASGGATIGTTLGVGTDLTVGGNANVTGDLTVDDITADDVSFDSLTVATSTATGTLNVTTDATIGDDLVVTGDLTANGAISLPNLVINDTQHGNRGGGALHALVVSGGAAGFMSGTQSAALDAIAATYVPSSRTMTAGAGMTGGGDLSANRTFNVVANADGSIVVNADDVQVGVLATDAQHGNRGGGALHALATALAAGFLSAADFIKLATIPAAGVDQSEILWAVTGSAASSAYGNGLKYIPFIKAASGTIAGQFSAKQSGTLTFRITYAMSVANGGNVALQLSRAVVSIGSDPNTALTPQTAGTITPGNDINIHQADNANYAQLQFAVTAGDEIIFSLQRLNDGTDTHTGDMRVIEIRVRYT